MKGRLYTVAFIEGFLVMAIELLSARLVTPVFGSTLYVWTSVLGLTMISLLSGYYLGGRLVSSGNYSKTFIYCLLISATWTLLMPFGAYLILKFSLSIGLILGSLVSIAFLIFVPLMLLGSISPQLIQLLNEQKTLAGKAAGDIYSISTLGGVLGTFFVGLYLIPTIGISNSCIGIGAVIFVYGLISSFQLKGFKKAMPYLIVTFLSALGTSYAYNEKGIIHAEDIELMYTSDSSLGRLDVVDINENIRVLSNNLTFQSICSKPDNTSIMAYTHVISTIASLRSLDTRNSVAIVGLAAGSLVREFKNLGYKKIDAIDIDARTQDVSNTYFGVKPENYTFYEDDGRHHFLSNSKMYDVIVIDVSASEQQPYHLYTSEAIGIYKSRLNPMGILIMNVLDYQDKKKQKILERVGDGLVSNDLISFMVKDFYSENLDKEENFESLAHEFILFAFNGEPNNLSNDIADMSACCAKHPFNIELKQNLKEMVFLKAQTSEGAFTDDLPLMESLSYERSRLLRTDYLFKKK